MTPKSTAGTREVKFQQTRQRLLDAAADEFARFGFEGANINRISIAAGYAKGTIYNYFSSKRDLMTALIETIATRHVAFIKDRIDPETKPKEKLAMFFQAGFSFVEQYSSQARIAISTVYGHDQEFRESLFDEYNSLFGLLQDDVLGEGMASGEFTDMDADFVSAVLMSIYLGSISLLNPDGKILLQPDQVADFILTGIGSDESDQVSEEKSYEI